MALGQQEFHQVTQLLHLVWGGFVAIWVCGGVYLRSLCCAQRRVYLVYAAYVVTAIVQLGALHGFGAYLFLQRCSLLSKNLVALTFGYSFFLYYSPTSICGCTKPEFTASGRSLWLDGAQWADAGIAILT